MKKIISLLISLTLVFMMCTSVLSVSANQDVSEEAVRKYALDFMRNSQEKDTLEISDFIVMYGVNDEQTGYYVTFSENKKESGYMILSLLTSGSPVVEFSFNGKGILMDVMEERGCKEEVRNILYTGPDSFYIEEDDGMYYAVYEGENVSKQQIDKAFFKGQSELELDTQKEEGTKSITIGGGILDWNAANISSFFKIIDFGSGTDYWLMTQLASGGVCYPTAATNILWYWGFHRNCTSISNKSFVQSQTTNHGKAQAIFDDLENNMGTLCWGTLDTNIVQGFEGFFDVPAQSGGVWNCKKLNNGSTYQSYKNALNDNCPIFLVVKTGTSIFADGHGMYNFGYASSTSGTKYLFVMDGWNNYGRFVKFSGYYPQLWGYKIWVR